MAQRIHAEVVFNGNSPVPAVSRMGSTARIQTQVAVNRIGAIKGLTATTAEAISNVYGITAEATEAGVHRLDRQDTLMARMGEDAAHEHQVAKENLRRRQQQLAEQAAGALQELFWNDLEDLLCQPDSAFYDPSLRERFATWFWDDISIELQRRNLPPLTPGERLKEVFIGGVKDAKVAAYDRQQIAQRRERLDIRQQLTAAQAQLVALAARNADLEELSANAHVAALGPGEAEEPTSDEEIAAQLQAVEELLRQVRGTEPADDSMPPRRARSNRRAEVIDAEPIG